MSILLLIDFLPNHERSEPGLNSFQRGWWKLKRRWEEDPEFFIGCVVVGLTAGAMFLTAGAKYKDARTRAKSANIHDREVARRERMTYRR